MSSVATTSPISVRDAASSAGAWPFDEARKIVFRIERTGQRQVVFETGYGPSGLPHIGTFGEVARTSMVRHAFDVLTGGEVKTRLIAFSDDMDGLRKVPDNIPNKELVAAHLGKPLTQIPDPFGTHASFGAHNNARLRGFLDQFGFDYEFASATDYYTSGRFDAALLRLLARYEAVMAIMLPSFRQERAATYSPFLPIHPVTGIVMQVPIEDINVAAGTIAWRDPQSGERFVTPVTGGHCKLQWKPDWAMRWYALGVDYEMAGKDLIDSVKLSGEIVRALGGTPPESFIYELFLDEKGQKISKSRGNGLAIEEWLTYASPESLSLFMYQKPTAAKRLYFDVIPRTVDDYLALLDAYRRQHVRERLGNPVWHIHAGAPPEPEILRHEGSGTAISFGMLLNLAAVANSEDPQVLWGFLRRYAPDVSPAKSSAPRQARHLCGALFPRLRPPEQDLSPARRNRARRLAANLRYACGSAQDRQRRRDSNRALRHRPAYPALSGLCGKRRNARAPGGLQRMVQHALPGAARGEPRPAVRFVHCPLWN